MPNGHSLASSIASLSASERATWLAQLSDAEALALRFEWSFWARQAQREPAGAWFIWLVKPGRGWGKTRCGAETVRAWVESGRYGRIALVNDTAADVRDVMVEGPDGLLAVSPPWNRPTYEPSKRRVTWPSGAQAICYAAEAPGLLRGPQHDAAWCDELAKWKNLQRKDESGDTAWSNLLMGLRMGETPRCVITTTPRPIAIITGLVKDPQTVVTHGRLLDNIGNLAPEFVRQMRKRYEGTRLGRQELEGAILEDTPGALWTREQIDKLRRDKVPVDLTRIVVAIDPAATATEESDETGLIVAGLGTDGNGYVLADKSSTYSPAAWGETAVQLFDERQADRIVGEVNNGGDMVGHTVQTAAQSLHAKGRRGSRYVAYVPVRASRGKLTRAEPIAALYEQGRVHHVGSFPDLEDQMATWMPGMPSPDRMDALVWALTDLMLNQAEGLTVFDTSAQSLSAEERRTRDDVDAAEQTAEAMLEVERQMAEQGYFWPGGR